MTTIRPATVHDHAGINRVSAEVGGLHARAHPDRFRETSDPLTIDHLRLLLDSPVHRVLVAERDGVIVGYEKLELRDAPEVPVLRPRRIVLVDEIGVLASERGRGIGRLLLDAATTWARENGAVGVELSVYEFNEAAIAFYERLGFTWLKRTMVRPLDGGQHDGGDASR